MVHLRRDDGRARKEDAQVSLLESQIIGATKDAVMRYMRSCDYPAKKEDCDQIATAYLSGITQTLHFLRANDGGVTVEQLDLAAKDAGKSMGFEIGRPN